MTTPELDEICTKGMQSWRNLNAVIGVLNEDQVSKMISHEMVNGRRDTFITRLHQRYTALRTARERAELLLGKTI
jgi:hypothetical protein